MALKERLGLGRGDLAGDFGLRIERVAEEARARLTGLGSPCTTDVLISRRKILTPFNKNASEYYKGSENKLALYFTHDWDVTNKLNLYYGARLGVSVL